MPKLTRAEALSAVKIIQPRSPIFAAELRGLFYGAGILALDDMNLSEAAPRGLALDGEQSFKAMYERMEAVGGVADKITEILLRENVSPEAIAEVLKLAGVGEPDANDEPPPFSGRPRPGGSRDPSNPPAMDGAGPGSKSFSAMFPGAETITIDIPVGRPAVAGRR